MTVSQPAADSLLRHLPETRRDSDKSDPAWLTPLRNAALSRFREVGLPTRRDEEWRFTDISPIVRTEFAEATPGSGASAADNWQWPASDGHQLVFVNGRFEEGLSSLHALPPGVTIASLAEVLADNPSSLESTVGRYAGFEHNAFVALNTALLRDGAVVIIPRNTVIDRPIHILHVASAAGKPTAAHPRTLIVTDQNSQATIVETYCGAGPVPSLTNAVTEIVVGENANIDHYKVQQEAETAYHVATMQVALQKGSVFSSNSIGFGGAIARSDANALLAGPGCECTLNGLYLATGTQVMDNHTAIDHAMPHCNSHEVYKGILDGESRGIFNGKIFVRQDAQKTDAKQTNKTLLLSERAHINTKPQLEIFADDVKCTHGATIGRLDAEALFYLRSRGIGADEARALLIYAFAGDIVNRVKVDNVRRALDAVLLERLPKETMG